jgi:1,4-alpha-glucan branching enzyme
VAAAPISPVSGHAVQFVLSAPGASGVSLVGDFNDWDPNAIPLRPTSDGAVWSVTIPLEPGRHEYAFLVDGSTWVPDPAATPSPGDDFGQPNSVITVGSSSL